MDAFIELFNHFGFAEVIMIIILTILGLKGVLTFGKEIKDNWEGWYQKKRKEEKKDESLEQRVNKLEENDKEQLERLDTISAGVQQIAASVDLLSENTKQQLKEIKENSDRRTIITTRSQLYRLHNEFMKKDSITMAESELFNEIADEYLACGGNSSFKDQIIPEVRSMKIRD